MEGGRKRRRERNEVLRSVVLMLMAKRIRRCTITTRKRLVQADLGIYFIDCCHGRLDRTSAISYGKHSSLQSQYSDQRGGWLSSGAPQTVIASSFRHWKAIVALEARHCIRDINRASKVQLSPNTTTCDSKSRRGLLYISLSQSTGHYPTSTITPRECERIDRSKKTWIFNVSFTTTSQLNFHHHSSSQHHALHVRTQPLSVSPCQQVKVCNPMTYTVVAHLASLDASPVASGVVSTLMGISK